MRLLLLDPRASGASGTKIAGALAHLAASDDRISEAINGLADTLPGVSSFEAHFGQASRGGYSAKLLKIRTKDEAKSRTADVLVDAVSRSLDRAGFGLIAKQVGKDTINSLGEAVAKVTASPREEVRLRELGRVETLAEVVATAGAAEILGVKKDTRVVTSPPALGGGLVTFSRGTMSVPAPATLEILARYGIPGVGGPVEEELTTPTGAALLAALIDAVVTTLPPMRPLSVGYGAGPKEIPGLPNFMRAILAEPLTDHKADVVYILEASVDDVSGDQLAYYSERLLDTGAKDVLFIPAMGKKGRPAHLIRVLSEPPQVEALVNILFSEGATLGIRILPCERRMATREDLELSIDLPAGRETVTVKVARGPMGQTFRAKPEYEQVRAIATKHKISFAKVLELIAQRVRDELGVGQ